MQGQAKLIGRLSSLKWRMVLVIAAVLVLLEAAYYFLFSASLATLVADWVVSMVVVVVVAQFTFMALGRILGEKAPEEEAPASQAIPAPVLVRERGLGVAEVALDPQEVLSHDLEFALLLLGSKTGAIMLLDEERQEFLPAITRGGNGELWQSLKGGWEDSFSGAVARGGSVVVVRAAEDERIRARTKEILASLGVECLISAPITFRDKVWGVLHLGCPSRSNFTLEELAEVKAGTEHIGLELECCKQRARANARLAELEKWAEQRTEFYSTVAHSLKTPLTSLRTSVEILLGSDIERASPQQRETILDNIKRSTERLNDLVTSLLDMARLRDMTVSMNLEASSIKALVEEISAMMIPVFESRRQGFLLDVPEDLPRVRVDRPSFERAVQSVLANASQFSPLETNIALRVRRREQGLVVEISDQGPGIPPQEREAIFEPFFRGQEARRLNLPGSGLGLSIARMAMERHGGKIWVESILGKGSTFYLSLPKELIVEDTGG